MREDKWTWPTPYDKIDVTYTVDFSHLIPEPKGYDGNQVVSWNDCDWVPEEIKRGK